MGVGQLVLPLFLFYAILRGDPIGWWLMALGMSFVSGALGISMCYHYLLTHRAFKAPKWIEYALSFFAGMCGLTSAIEWVLQHRAHHLHSDEPLDPHSPKQMGWRAIFYFWHGTQKYNFFAIRHIKDDPFHRFMHRHYYAILAGYVGALFLINPLLPLYAWAIPACYTIWAFIGFVYAHDLEDKPIRRFLARALIFFAEGDHDEHHRNERKWLGAKPIQWIVGCLGFRSTKRAK